MKWKKNTSEKRITSTTNVWFVCEEKLEESNQLHGQVWEHGATLLGYERQSPHAVQQVPPHGGNGFFHSLEAAAEPTLQIGYKMHVTHFSFMIVSLISLVLETNCVSSLIFSLLREKLARTHIYHYTRAYTHSRIHPWVSFFNTCLRDMNGVFLALLDY